jgi:hypothetical protein
MSFTINANFLANARSVAHLGDGSEVVFSQGKFDACCIYHVGNSVIKGVRVILNELSSYLLIKRGWFNGEKTTSF